MGENPTRWTHEEVIARHNQWLRQLYLQTPEPADGRCETVGGPNRERRCPEVAAYTVRVADSADDHDICERCLLAWVHNTTAAGRPVLVRRYRPDPPPELF